MGLEDTSGPDMDKPTEPPAILPARSPPQGELDFTRGPGRPGLRCVRIRQKSGFGGGCKGLSGREMVLSFLEDKYLIDRLKSPPEI